MTASRSGATVAPKPTPAQLGYRMPAEWEPHAGTWLTWPRPEGISFPDKYEPVPGIIAELVRTLVQTEEVNLNVWDSGMEASVRQIFERERVPLDRVFFRHFPAYEPWCRDHGPIFLVRDMASAPPLPKAEGSAPNWPRGEAQARDHKGQGALPLPKGEGKGEGNGREQINPTPPVERRADRHNRAVVDWAYNAWGNKYPPCDLDDAVPQHVAKLRSLPLFSPGIVMEGGSIEVNGCGTVLTTEACLLNPNRNPGLNKAQIEQYLKNYLGVTNVLWLNEGIVGDDTDGHIDDLTRFVDPTTVVTVVEDDPADENYSLLQENLVRLRSMRDQDNRRLRIVELPMPGKVEYQGQRLPASYANFYIANEQVIVPTFRHPNDQRALEILKRQFPTRRVVGMDSTELIWGLGSFHCLTQQEPA